MTFTETSIAGAFLLEPERIEDERGFLARTWSARELEARGLETRIVQCSLSYNERRGTIRGLHYQAPPHEEVKIVRCTMGSLHDVIVDARPASRTSGRWHAVQLTAKNRLALYIPEGVAHGYQTLEDWTEVFYQISESYHPESARGIRWNDPAFGIAWPAPPTVISTRDASFPLVGGCG